MRINHAQVQILAKPRNVDEFKLALANRLDIGISFLKQDDDALKVEIGIDEIVARLSNSRVNYLGIVHVNSKGETALAETYYSEEGSHGYCTAGGYNASPYFPEYGSLVESSGEFNVRRQDISNLILLVDREQKYCTTISYDRNNVGQLAANASEFRKDSQGWYSAKRI